MVSGYQFALRVRNQPTVLNPGQQLPLIFTSESLRGRVFWKPVFQRHRWLVTGPFPRCGPYALGLVVFSVKIRLVEGNSSTHQSFTLRKFHFAGGKHGLNAIRQLGGMTMFATGEVKFPQRERLMCAAITLDEPDFHAKWSATRAKCDQATWWNDWVADHIQTAPHLQPGLVRRLKVHCRCQFGPRSLHNTLTSSAA